MCISDKIAEMRKQNNMTQKDLAEKLNVSDKVISKWETGKCLPDVEMMMKLSRALGVSISELYECVEKTTTGTAEDYNEERIWQYKKYSIVSYFLILLSLVFLLFLTVNWSRFDNIEDILRFILIMLSIASFTLGIFFQITQFIRLYSYSKNKYYREEYVKVMKKYGIIFLVCLSVVLIFPLIVTIIANVVDF
ncbi:MAG: helix-turn-helix transcriptional regulator [Clostridia bacterium]|nr:helix-turn-helix transcriptional regulator [Clostridia bacterium]